MSTPHSPHPEAIGTCPVCHDQRVAFEDAGTVRRRRMVECGACGAVVPLAEVDQDGHLPPVRGGDGPVDPEPNATSKGARLMQEVVGRMIDKGAEPIVNQPDHSQPRTFVEIVRSAQAGLHEVHDALAELGVEGSIPTHIADEVRKELVSLDDKVTDLAEFIADVARGNRPEDLRALEPEDPDGRVWL